MMLFLTALAVPALLYFAAQVETNTQDVHTWLPTGTESRETYDRFVDLFGHDDDIIISWEGCHARDPRLAEFTERLVQHRSGHGCFARVLSGKMILDQLVHESGFSESQAKARLEGVFFGDQGQTTGIIVQLSDRGRENRRHCFEEVAIVAAQTAGLNLEDIRLGGSSYFSVEIDNATNKALTFSAPAAGLAVLVTFFCLGSFRLTGITLFVAGLASLASVSIVCFFGFKINGLLVMMPVLVLVLTLSGGVHLASYYRKCFDPNDGIGTVKETMRLGWRPCALAMLTTSIGILMLYTSHVEAVRHFAMFSALSLIVALFMLLTLYPALLSVWTPSRAETERNTKRKRRTRLGLRAETGINNRSWVATLGVGVVVAAIPFLIAGLDRIQTTLRPENMFRASSHVNQNSRWLNDHFVAVESIEVVASFDRSHPIADQIRTINLMQAALCADPSVSNAFSFANLCKPVPKANSIRNITKRTGINRRVERQLPKLIEQRIIAAETDQLHWRIRLSVDVENDADYDALVAAVSDKSVELASKTPLNPQTMVTGIWPLSASGRHQLFNDLASSFILAFVIITPLIMLILGGFTVGLISMLPNAFPALLFFGVMGWTSFPVDVGMILTASVGLGIAVDDTLHFLECYVRQRRSCRNRSRAVWNTVWQCGRPMLNTTLICGAGLSVFAASEFIPARQFAIAIVLLLGLALVCDLILLPALILGPFGEFFDRKPTAEGRQDNLAEESRPASLPGDSHRRTLSRSVA